MLVPQKHHPSKRATYKTRDSQQLVPLPLLFRFSVFNNHTYSPLDTPADWMLAKAVVGALDIAFDAAAHFVQCECRAGGVEAACWPRCLDGCCGCTQSGDD